MNCWFLYGFRWNLCNCGHLYGCSLTLMYFEEHQVCLKQLNVCAHGHLNCIWEFFIQRVEPTVS